MPRGHSLSIYVRFRAKRELQCIFPGEKAIIITSNYGTTIFFLPLQSFSRKNKEELTRIARVNTPGYPIILLKSN